MNTIIEDYKHTWLFYFLATLLPWTFWGIAAYISHSTDFNYPGELASLIAFAGLLSPVVIALVLVYRNRRLKSDILQRLIKVNAGKTIYWVLTRMALT